MGHHRSASATRLLGLDGFEVLAAGGRRRRVAARRPDRGHRGRVQGPRVRAELHRCRAVRMRDLLSRWPSGVLAWRKRIWRCRAPACGVHTWTERAAPIRPRAVLTQRACAQACRRVGKELPRRGRGRP